MALLQIAEPGQAQAPHEHRLAAGIDTGRYRDIAGLPIDTEALAEFVAHGFMTRDGTGIAVTAKGRPVLNRLVLDLLARPRSRGASAA